MNGGKITASTGHRTTAPRIWATRSRPADRAKRSCIPPAIHAYLNYLHDNGFDAAPRIVGDGFNANGHEVLSWIDGTIHPHTAWASGGIAACDWPAFTATSHCQSWVRAAA